jgi:YD repeat-containing protein
MSGIRGHVAAWIDDGRRRGAWGIGLLGVAALVAGVASATATPTPASPPAWTTGTATAVFDRGGRERPLATAPVGRLGEEIVALRTARSRTYTNAAGSYVARVFAEPVNHRGADGRWRKIDNRLERTAGGGLSNRSNRYDVQLPDTLAEPVAVREGDDRIAFRLLGAEGAPDASGNTARYDDALPSVDAVYEARGDALKETLVLADREAPHAFAFQLSLSDGLTARLGDADAVEFTNEHGAVVASFAPPFMEDAGGRASRAVETRLERAGAGYRLTLTADRGWLDDPARRYPVRLDPTIDLDGADQDCYVVSAQPDTNLCGYENVDVGLHGSARSRALLTFDVAKYVPKQAEVLDAELELYLYAKTSATATPVTLHRLTRAWSDAWTGVTWNRYDGVNPWTAPGGDFEAAAAATAQNVGTKLGFVRWHPTELVQRWLDGTAANHGMLLKTPETVANRLSFDSTYTEYDTPPYLAVTYEPRAGQLTRYEFDGEEPPEPVDQDGEFTPEDFRFDVNVANGNLLLRERDLFLDAIGPDFEFERYYNNLDENITAVGGGFTTSAANGVELLMNRDGSIVFYGPSGYAKRFAKNADGSYTAPRGLEAELVRRTDGTYTLALFETDDHYTFDAEGLVLSRADEDGAKLVYAYNGYDDLISVTDAEGRKVTFTYDGAGMLKRMTEPGGARVHTYAYDGDDHLTSYTAPDGKRTQLYWDYDQNLVKVRNRAGAETRFTYDAHNRVTSVTRVTDPAAGTGPKTTYAYATASTTVTAPDSRRSVYGYDASSIVRHVATGPAPPSVTLSGALKDHDGRTLTADAAYALRIDAADPNGIAEVAIEVDDSEDAVQTTPPCSGTTCVRTWTLFSEEQTPGEKVVRVIVTDGAGDETVRSLVVSVPPWADGPVPAAPPPETQAERLAAAQGFRQQFGFPSDDATVQARDTDPASQEGVNGWGHALNLQERQEMLLREDVQNATGSIYEYVEETPAAKAAFAGIHIDQDAGGLVRIAFTGNTAAHMAEIADVFPYTSRLRSVTHARSLAELKALQDRISADRTRLEAEGYDVKTISLNIGENVIEVGVPAPSAAIDQQLKARYGPGVRVIYGEALHEEQNFDRFRRYRRIAAGLAIYDTRTENDRPPDCTVAWSAYRRSRGRTSYYHITAGHCGDAAFETWHQGRRRIGQTLVNYDSGTTNIDAQVITGRRRRSSTLVFGPAFRRTTVGVERIGGPRHPWRESEGEEVCISGAVSGHRCGELTRTDHEQEGSNGSTRRNQRMATYHGDDGDSGAPIYRRLPRQTALAVGVHSGRTRTGFLFLQTRRVYSHASLIQQDARLSICARGRARCGR